MLVLFHSHHLKALLCVLEKAAAADIVDQVTIIYHHGAIVDDSNAAQLNARRGISSWPAFDAINPMNAIY
jgi:hypothetical protein